MPARISSRSRDADVTGVGRAGGMRWRNKRGGLRWLVVLGLCFVLSSVLVALLYGLTRTRGPLEIALGVVMTLIPVVGLVLAIARPRF